MLVEIWSDIMCPFCYIGKQHFEKALNSLSFKDKIEVLYKSYQLDPNYHNESGENTYAYLSRSKGMSTDQVKEMTGNVEQMGQKAGLIIDFSKNIPANTFMAHQLIHFANTEGKAIEITGRLFKAHFEEGLDIGKEDVLATLAEEEGLSPELTKQALHSDQFAYEVKQDINEAQQIGVRGVPFFLFDRKYALSGAQPIEVFVEVLEKSYQEWLENNRDI